MTFELTTEQLPTFHPLPGHALIRTAPPQYKSHSGLLHIPKGIAHYQQEGSIVRKGELVNINRFGKGAIILGDAHFWDGEADDLTPSQTVYYWGHLDEADNQFVVVKIGQIVAVEVTTHP